MFILGSHEIYGLNLLIASSAVRWYTFRAITIQTSENATIDVKKVLIALSVIVYPRFSQRISEGSVALLTFKYLPSKNYLSY